ncbi:putative sulfate/molybdate transporter [Pseudodesulfovibrio tunisiensis]|uniref:putative sulfate/molybdate transporter n=1 Tax=Pseudodesulfovibrio tunisiensis TaxID=463192 RepID=UPI001FB3B36B|nr:putative sulfate/molybdate transporter [Pseudodesulfovibrio tunisiensis]
MTARFNRMEWAGAVGDLGTLLPLAFAMIMMNGLSPTGLFLSVGLYYIAAGMYFRVPVAVQPMKVVSAYAIAQTLSPQSITASGILLAATLLILGLTGLVDRVSRLTPKSVIRGVQLTTGVLLLAKGVSLVMGTHAFQLSRQAVEPFLAMQHLGPIPMSLIMGAIFGVATLFLLDNRRFPAGIVVVGVGALVGGALGAWQELAKVSPGLHLPDILPFGLPEGPDFSLALLVLVLPQVPMTLGNAVIANRDLSHEYFGEQASRVTDRALCVSMGLANVLAALIGGMPLCHGAGGLAAHYRFGARTNGSNLIVGTMFVVLALLLGTGAVAVLHLIPLGALGVLLIFAGAELAMTVRDMEERQDMFVVAVMLGIALAANLAWGFAVGICLHYLLRSDRFTV